MITNLIHCALIGQRADDRFSDYTPAEYSARGETLDEKKIRGLLIGTAVPRSEQRNFTSILCRWYLSRSPFVNQASLFGIEGGYALSDLMRTLFDAYTPENALKHTLSPAATNLRDPLFTFRSLYISSIRVRVGSNNVDFVTVNNHGYGQAQGSRDEPIIIPGMTPESTITVHTLGDSTVKWATAPLRSVGQVAEDIRNTGVPALRTLAGIPGRIGSDDRSQLIRAVEMQVVPSHVVSAAALLLTNAVSARLVT